MAAGVLRSVLGRLWPRLDDETLAGRVREALSRPGTPPDVAASASGGVVELEGDVGPPYTQAAIDAAVRAAEEVRGVRRVESRLRLVDEP